MAGFIASKVAELLLADGHTAVGVDNLNDAYDVRLKHWRLEQLEGKPGLEFRRLDIGTNNLAARALIPEWEGERLRGVSSPRQESSDRR